MATSFKIPPQDIALSYLSISLSVLPADPKLKRPTIGWKQYQQRLPSVSEVNQWFKNPPGFCVVCGAVSGGLEMIDFDQAGKVFVEWTSKVPAELLGRLVIERSPSGGFHVIYRAPNIPGNLKLATDENGVLIETRGEGGLFLCAPTEGYEFIDLDFGNLQTITESERELLIEAAESFDESSKVSNTSKGVVTRAEERRTSYTGECASSFRPGDIFNQQNEVADTLLKHGWVLVQEGDNQRWRRPGKEEGTSATYKNKCFYVFSSNAAPFEPNEGYSPFAVYALLEFGGDFSAAAASIKIPSVPGLAEVGEVDLSQFNMSFNPSASSVSAQGDDVEEYIEEDPEENLFFPADPGNIDEDLLRIPGFISEVMDHCMEIAPYPNQVLSLCGAMALQAMLGGRKVRDSGDNRTNLYLLGLAHSSAGKDAPRKLNNEILYQVGLSEALGNQFASGEGLQDAMFTTPCMLFQTDEIDGILQSINKSKDARHEGIMNTMLSMYSTANSVMPMRRKAGFKGGSGNAGAIDQPCLVVFGTAIPNHFYEALSSRMLTNGFFARLTAIETTKRGEGQEPSIKDIPTRVLETAEWWSTFTPGKGNLASQHPIPKVVEYTSEAKELLSEARRSSELEYGKAEEQGDAVGTAVWGRCSEQTRKMALIYAISENHLDPVIGKPAVEWGIRFVNHLTKQMLHRASYHVSQNAFHAECLRLMDKLKRAKGKELSHSQLLKRMKISAKNFEMIVNTLLQSGEILLFEKKTGGRPSKVYSLLS